MNKIFIISECYPYGNGEDWMQKELQEASKFYDQIFICPLNVDKNEPRWTPINCSVIDDLAIQKKQVSNSYLLRNMVTVFSILWVELTKNHKSYYLLKKFRFFLAQIKQVLAKVEIFNDIIIQNWDKVGTVHFYSVWMNDGALILSILKRKKRIPNMFFRLHGYDLFDERREGQYMPFRAFNFKHTNCIFVLSQQGVDYTRVKNIFPDKLQLNYSGLYDFGEGPFNKASIFTIVSCSNLSPFKRVDLLAESISTLPFPVRWIHFGSGHDFEKVKARTQQFSGHISVDFKGQVPNKDIIGFYAKNHVNLFVHLSETEGLGMAAVEAQSFGIPTIAIDVGGVKEVVTPETGILMELRSTVEEITSEIIRFQDSEKNNPTFRKKVRNAFLNKFEAKKNYDLFFRLVAEKVSKK